MRRLPPLRSLQVFEAAARLGSFAEAGNELHLTPSAISHHIRDLEDRLEVTLFHRFHRQVILTDLGRSYAKVIRQSLGAITTATQTIERRGKVDILTIHCVPSLASQWLMHRLSRFSSQYPDIEVRINSAVAAVDLIAEQADFDIRYGPVVRESSIVINPFPMEPLAVVCTPELATGEQPIKEPADLINHTLIHSEINLITWKKWVKDYPGLELNLKKGPKFDRSFMSINYAVEGLGVALESRLLTQREIESKKLVMPLGTDNPKLVFHNLVYLKSKEHLPKMVVFKNWLFEQLEETFKEF